MRDHPSKQRVAGFAAAVLVATLVAPAAASPPQGDQPPTRSWAETRPTRDGAQPERPAYRPGELLVAFDPREPEAERGRVRARYDLEKIEDLPLDGVELVRMRGAGGPPERASSVQGERSVRFAEPNLLYRPASAPDDPEFVRQWALDNAGQTGGTSGADIEWLRAQDLVSDPEDVVVAVIDTGTDLGHEDLAANAWVNPDEALDGTDTDGNGYVDDIHGWNYCGADNQVFDEIDRDEHGTHVAGTIAAVTGNGIGVAGVSRAKIMALKFLCPSGALSDAVKAIDYAIANGARVINASWGGGGFSSTLEAAIERANQAGILFVAAAGNEGTDNDSTAHYPSNYGNDNVVAVAATTHSDDLASFSNHGATTVDLGAPGASILSTLPRFAKAIAVGPDTDPSVPYRSLYHTFGLEGVSSSADRRQILDRGLTWTGTASTAPILLVDDDGGESYETVHQDALRDLGFGDVATHTVSTSGSCSGRDGPTAETMTSYAVVIWFTGATFGCTKSPPTLTATDQSRLAAYLNDGGNLLLFGMDIGYELTANGTTTSAFYRDTLRADYLSDFDDNYRLAGMPGTPYEGTTETWLDIGKSDTGQFYTDLVRPRAGAVAAIRVMGTSWYSGTSMAAPHVAGAAAQLHASHPGMSHMDVKSRLMGEGDLVASLVGNTVSGRRLNLANAIDIPAILRRAIGDFDGDGTTDIAVFRPSNGTWYLRGYDNIQWGVQAGDIPVPGDYDGDGSADVAVYRPSSGTWYVRGQFNVTWGVQAGDIPVPGDYDGDGTTDVAVYRPSSGTWYVRDQFNVRWGIEAGDVPVPGDYDGDGVTDVAVFRPSNGTWYIRGVGNFRWGVQAGDVPVPGDYDGDGVTDVAVFRPSNGTWYVRDGFKATWGVQSGDVPVPGDYDGDGTVDIAVFRPSNGNWYVRGQFNVRWGIEPGDLPLPLPHHIHDPFFGS